MPWETPPSSIDRAPLLRPLSPTEHIVVMLLGVGYQYPRVARELGLSERSVRDHALMASRKMPGDLQAQARCIMWARGASVDVLTGAALLGEVTAKAIAFTTEARFLARRTRHRARTATSGGS